MTYIDIAVYAVPTANKADFIAHSEKMLPIFKKHGALSVADCWGDDIPEGKITSLPMAVKCEETETVCFSWIMWSSKEARNDGMGQAMQDMQAAGSDTPPPFDGMRMIFGGFEPVVEA